MEDASDQPALQRLEAFVGAWTMEVDFPNAPTIESTVRARTEFERMLDGRFLAQRAEVDHPDAPDLFAVIAVDVDGDGYTQHYFDARGVVRTYAMTFDGNEWTLSRETADFSPLEFSQRFTGTFDADGTAIRGTWEICHDGTNWEHDFDLHYRRADG